MRAIKVLEVRCAPFVIDKPKAVMLKPLEEAAEAFGAWQDKTRKDVIYELCDTIQACFNALELLGATQDEITTTMSRVFLHNEERGRYNTQEGTGEQGKAGNS